MKTKKFGLHPTARLETGTAILAAAQVVDTTPVKARLAAFAKVHRRYVEAQRTVETAEARLGVIQKAVAELDAKQDEVVEGVARSLVNDGQLRRNPFVEFSSATPSGIKELPIAEKAKAIHKLVAAVQADKTATQATLRAVRAAEQTAKAVEAALLPLNKLEATLRTAREAREHIGQIWQPALAALKRSARSADDNGGPALSTALFGGLRRAATKKDTPTATPAPVESPAAQPAAPAS